MIKKIRNSLRNFLGISDEMSDVWLCITVLQNEVDAHFSTPIEAGGVVEQTEKPVYQPNQTGNVVVSEPKFVRIMRKQK